MNKKHANAMNKHNNTTNNTNHNHDNTMSNTMITMRRPPPAAGLQDGAAGPRPPYHH